MGKLKQLHERLKRFDPNKTLNETIDTAKNEQFIAQLVRDRLLKEGTDSTGKKIKTYSAKGGNFYADYTISLKQAMGLTYSHVTLLDTGSFHKSLELQILKDAFNLEGDTEKEDGNIEDNVDLTNVMNLSDQEKSKLVNEIRSEYIAKTREAVRI